MATIIKPAIQSLFMHVWIHSDAETGQPSEVCAFDIDGKMNMEWFSRVFEDQNNSELADEFYKVFRGVEDSAWFKVQPIMEVSDEGMGDYWLEVTSLQG